MIKDLEIETYLCISPNLIGIYLFDKKNFKNLFQKEVKFNNATEIINFKSLDLFLEQNIFKIEKKIGKFIKNISLIIEDNSIYNINLGIKKKNYEKTVSKKNLENTLVDAKDLFKENFKDGRIMHILLRKYSVNGNQNFSYQDNLQGDYFCIEIEFIYILNNLILEIEKILEKYQISGYQYLYGAYIKDFFNNTDIEIPEMACKIQNGFNINEIQLIPKNQKKIGIFEKFFQLFS